MVIHSLQSQAEENVNHKMLTVQEVAQRLHVHPDTVRQWSDLGLLKVYHLGPRRDRIFSEADLVEFLSQLGEGGLETEGNYIRFL
ncbi:MAG: helix-turn-helix domain-containing protein [Dehalococcoidia bacterium]